MPIILHWIIWLCFKNIWSQFDIGSTDQRFPVNLHVQPNHNSLGNLQHTSNITSLYATSQFCVCVKSLSATTNEVFLEGGKEKGVGPRKLTMSRLLSFKPGPNLNIICATWHGPSPQARLGQCLRTGPTTMQTSKKQPNYNMQATGNF
jgi:hypothetical protein